jgi:DNA topoisomerase-2
MAERYKKLDQREHILLRPDTYVGDLTRRTDRVWVIEDGAAVRREIAASPALLKIFDEILVNAADSRARDASMTTLKVTVTDQTVSVWNDGATIPVAMHPEGCYVPELIFGHLLTGENYDDALERTAGGRNGFGAKLTNVFSKTFDVEVCDGIKKYKQKWTDNMRVCHPPKITTCAQKKYVCVTFSPDFARFGMTAMDPGVKALFERRTYDMAAVLGAGVRVSFDGKRLGCKSFADYVKLFAPHAAIGDNVAIARSDEFDQVSFVNSVRTDRGGTHVAFVADAVARAVTEAAAKKKIVVKPSAVKNHAFVFVNVTAVNPTFDTQSKEFLTSKTKIALPDAFLKKAAALLLPDVIAEATVRASLADERNLKKTDGSKKSRVTGIAKLTDANWAGTRRSGECTLILTEGDSAKSLAVAGLTVVGRDKYGVFPLRGKLLNCRDAAVAAVANNVEITALKQILGLQTGKTYADASGLRYGHVMVMADSDHDGAHIAGLVVNFFHACFPSLVEIRGFFQKFITPIVRAKRGREIVSFYSLPELDEWTRATPTHREWTLKYYKVSKTSSRANSIAFPVSAS